nr:hypothetical protein [uncultured Fluviicola sp.]
MKNVLYGEDYRRKSNLFDARIKEIEAAFVGEFDYTNPYYTIFPNGKNGLIMKVDDSVPEELKKTVLRMFSEVWS